MEDSPNKYQREDAMGNLFFLCPEKKFMFISISKNACTSLKHLLFIEAFGEPFEQYGQSGIHECWGFCERAGRIVDRLNYPVLSQYSDYLRFVVYRDPVERFLSTYYNKVLYPPKPHVFYQKHKLNGLGLDAFIDVSEEILSNENPLTMDEHLRPQSACFCPDEVDFIVPLEKLEYFVTDELGCRSLPHNNKVTLNKLKPDIRQTERIRVLYSADYQIRANY